MYELLYSNLGRHGVHVFSAIKYHSYIYTFVVTTFLSTTGTAFLEASQ